MHPTAPEHLDPWERRPKLLAVADVQTGYHHGSISHALATLERIGRESGDFVTEIRTDSQLITRRPILGTGSKYGGRPVNARNLNEFGALFLLPSGSGTLTEEQRSDLLAFVHDDGKGLVAGHAALVGFFDWPDFGNLLGGRLAGEFDGTAKVLVEAPDFPGADAFGDTAFDFTEQHAIVAPPYDRHDCRVVMRLDPESLPPQHRAKRPDQDFPVVWTRQFGAGRVCSITWGHHEATWDDPRFQGLVRGAVRWAFGPDGL